MPGYGSGGVIAANRLFGQTRHLVVRRQPSADPFKIMRMQSSSARLSAGAKTFSLQHSIPCRPLRAGGRERNRRLLCAVPL
jgi:hypothetical protein